MSVLDNWDSWKDFLGDRLHQAEGQGINNRAVSELAYEIGGYLANSVDAKNNEEAVLRDLWNVADEKEQHAIANMMVKLVQNNGSQQ
ncbi:DUF3243 family protein [Halobacillus litoralis]|uniref:DUF3243 family protein n=1 Tax=Halobacillus litoralis TaxID=45668 RepID=A0A845DPC1_9BACI|nr:MULTISPECIES: DUF3243 domain-containing protein [Halobacillus]MCA1023129.1 DUF3243 domain-containing protein [Halobacillus litoralis]MYL19256.1 DUF3243 family protein [Halobacillus litoralis]MYL28402.1 DUF3243 family protein [Halobacillus halophilus]MYL37666.1 DUF3243 family protein [Halobacillus litoralis]